MKKLPKKGMLLFAGAMAVCALAMPTASPAASWGVIGSEHTFHSPDFSFSTTDPVLGAINTKCLESTLTVDVRNAAALTITNATFNRCTAGGIAIGDCTATPEATNLHWTATGVTTTNVQIHGVRIDVKFETIPGSDPDSCRNIRGTTILVTGTLTGGHWVSSLHEFLFLGAEGLVAHSATGNNLPVTVFGTFRDTQQTLTLS
jgi:hypothetical protein